MVSLKSDTVELKELAPQLVLAILMAQEVYNEYDCDLVLTSANDSSHSTSSLHYSGSAVDLRTSNLPDGRAVEVRDKIASKLNKDFDVVLEGDHIHLEYQPKKR